MGQIDTYDLGVTVGRIEQKVDSLILIHGDFKKDIAQEISAHDVHIQSLLPARAESRGKAIAYGSISGFAVLAIGKIIDHFPAIVKSIIG